MGDEQRLTGDELQVTSYRSRIIKSLLTLNFSPYHHYPVMEHNTVPLSTATVLEWDFLDGPE